MFSLRDQLAARLPDWVDHLYSIFHPSWNPVWGDVVPAPAVGAVAAGTRQGVAAASTLGTPPPANHLARLLVCRRDLGGCGAQPGQRCTTKGGKVTGEHAARQRP